MKIHLNRHGSFRIKDQIKRQIRMLVESGNLSIGHRLPSAKDMAETLSVNRNTVATAYRELVSEGYLEAVVGKGTFVMEKPSTPSTEVLTGIFEEAIEKAVKRGFTRARIEDFMLTSLSTSFSRLAKGRVLVVECNREAIDNIAHTLRSELGVESVELLVQELETNPERILRDVLSSIDLVVCGINHVEDFRRAFPDIPIEIVAIMTQADVRIVNELRRLPPNTRVCFCCANQESTESFFKESMLSGGTGVTKVWLGLDNTEDLKRHLSQCQVVIANGRVYDKVLEFADPSQRVIRLESNIDRANVDLIWERLVHARSIRRSPNTARSEDRGELT